MKEVSKIGSVLILLCVVTFGVAAEIKEPAADDAALRSQFRELHERSANGDESAKKILYAWKRRGVAQEDYYVNVAAIEKKVQKGADDPELLAKLGGAYLLGQGGLVVDANKAKPLLEKASKAGNALASHNLATIYSEGIGESKDISKAREFYLLSAEQGRAEGFAHVGNIERDAKNIKGAIDFYIAAGEKGDSASFKKAADFLLKKNAPVADRKRGLTCLERAAAMGDYRAAYEAAVILYKGEPGIPSDLSVSSKYFSQAIESKWEPRVHEFFYPSREESSPENVAIRESFANLNRKKGDDLHMRNLLTKLERTHEKTEKVRAKEKADAERKGKGPAPK